MSRVKDILRAAQKAEELSKVYQLAINYLSEVSDGVDDVSSREQGIGMLSREAFTEVIERLKDLKDDALESVDLDPPEPPSKEGKKAPVPKKKVPRKKTK